jgi:S-formylglutathione hydrolase FrmB
VTFPALFVDVGTDDELLHQSRAFRWELERLGIPVTYAEWPGAHTWDYWRRHAAESVTWLAERLSK